jgi:hypothetical protein
MLPGSGTIEIAKIAKEIIIVITYRWGHERDARTSKY